MTKKLLLADDSITIQKVIGIIFETEDYQLLMTDNGDEAFTRALEELPDLVIADISMPGKDGFELCRAIKANPQLVATSVMLLPGTFDHFDEERAQAVGADGWLTKPFESQALLDKVTQLLEADPVRLIGEAPEVTAEEPVADFEPPAVEELEAAAAPAVDEVVLGLDEMEGSAVAEEMIEESADDIWDAVSFEEDDLQPQDELSVEETPESVDLSFADTAAVEAVTAEEPAEESSLELMDELVTEEPVAEAAAFAAAEDATMLGLAEQEPVVGAEALVLPEEGDEELLELVDEVLESSSSEVVAGSGIEELEPIDLMGATVVVEEPVGENLVQPLAAAGDEFIVEDAVVEEVLPVVGPLSEESLDEDEDILDLADEDILDEEPLLDATVVESAEPIELEEEVVEEESFVAEEEVAFAEEITTPVADFTEPVESEEQVAEEESFFIEEEVSLADEAAESIDAPEETLISPAVEEDEGFYFDSSEVAEAEVAESAAPGAAFVATTAAAAVASVKTEGDIEQVEQQLRRLSDDDLKEVVTRVAGPIIERLAGKMLEQIAWEVVPDLAESMIREEIRKIKQAEE